ncbi:MAG TPA: hypothetical protein VNL17_11850 [Verrucomicrobiae bacterium]|nr:hypothetical protein [Verrucomicrobiae bacterium]
MGKIFLTYGAVPELAPLSPAKRIEVLLASGGRFGKTPLHKRVWWLGVILSVYIPATVGLFIYHWSNNPSWACWISVGLGLLGYSTWFHIRTSCLRPYMRAYLAENGTPRKAPIKFYWWRGILAMVLVFNIPLALVSAAFERSVTVWTFLPGLVIDPLLLGFVYVRVRRRGNVSQ